MIAKVFTSLMPLYPMSLDELLKMYKAPLPVDRFLHVANGLLSAGSRFQEKNLSHCDIKQSNIMMNCCDPVLIDFGAVVTLGDPIVECTPNYSLNANQKNVTPQFDLYCIVTTLVFCFLPTFEIENRGKNEMAALIRAKCTPSSKKYCKICLALLDCDSCLTGLNWVLKLLDKKHHLCT
jgi:serine/threonine protein kinase